MNTVILSDLIKSGSSVIVLLLHIVLMGYTLILSKTEGRFCCMQCM
jgi:hypothetical protein